LGDAGDRPACAGLFLLRSQATRRALRVTGSRQLQRAVEQAVVFSSRIVTTVDPASLTDTPAPDIDQSPAREAA